MNNSIDIAILSDIHSNYIALERCMEYAVSHEISRFLFLGDYVGELAYHERTMELLFSYKEKYDCVFIRGNKEDYWIKQRRESRNDWKEFDSTTGALWYAYNHLKSKDINFFESLPIVSRVQFDGFPTLIACHGSPYAANEDMRAGEERTKEIMDTVEASVILSGHTHIQSRFQHQGRILLNPGSVGLSSQAGGQSQFMILHGKNGCWKEEFVSLEYDRLSAIEQLSESGLAERASGWCRVTKRQLQGTRPEITHTEILKRVTELCHQETGKWSWPDLPEKYWDMALAELFEEKKV